MKTLYLIQLYCAVCQYYDSILSAENQRLSNNFRPKFSDEECLTIYLFGIAEGKFEQKAAYQFILDYFPGWFPALPSYQKFNYRVNRLSGALLKLCGLLMNEMIVDESVLTHLLDSFPVVVAKGSRSGRAKAVSELCNKGYCDSKDMWYYGIKVHVLARKQLAKMPVLRGFEVSPASCHDLTAAKPMLYDCRNFDLAADKAYCDTAWRAELASRGVRLFTPRKAANGQPPGCDCVSTFVASERQPIESLFNWINEKTHIESASKVRSLDGLIAFIAVRLAAAALFFNP